MNKDYKGIRQKIKQNLNRDNVEAMLESLGVEISHHRFKHNKSYSIDRNGRIKDFGSDNFSGDIVAFMIDVLGIHYQDSVEWVAECVL